MKITIEYDVHECYNCPYLDSGEQPLRCITTGKKIPASGIPEWCPEKPKTSILYEHKSGYDDFVD